MSIQPPEAAIDRKEWVPPSSANRKPSAGNPPPPPSGKLRQKIRRALDAGLPGLADRGRQELQRRLDRTAIAIHPNRALPRHGFAHLNRLSSERHVVATPEAPMRFFAGVDEDGLGAFIASEFPAVQAQVVARANAACEGRLQLLGYRLRFEGARFDWHRDPVAGRSAPRVHWSRIDPLSPASVGDSKIVWELNRHQWLAEVALAWRLTGEERYAQFVVATLRDWMRANPPGIGINWASSLEVSFRLIAWCWLLKLLADSPALSAQFRETMRDWIRLHAMHVEKYMSHYFSPNTHLTGEALGLIYASALLAHLPRAKRWRRIGIGALLDQLHRHVLADGVYFEQSTWYALYTADIYLHAFILAERIGIDVPTAAKARLPCLIDFLVAIRRPDGTLPRIGDDDGGSLLPFCARAPGDCRGTLAVAAAWFERADYAWAAGGPAPEVALLLGRAGYTTFTKLAAKPPSAPASQALTEGGYAIMRGGWEADAHQLVLDAGPLSGSLSGGHGHADLLSIQCATFGRPRLVDPGTCCYTPEPAWRDYFRSSHAHNTITVDGQSQAAPAGPFAWRARPAARLRRWVSTPQFDFADAEHHAYTCLRDPVVHRRRVLFVKPHYWLVVDDLYGHEAHQVAIAFQFASQQIIGDANGWTIGSGTDGHGLFLRSFADVELESRLVEAERAPIGGWTAPNYGLREPAPQLVSSAHAALPLRIITLLLPKSPDDTEAPDVTFADDRLTLGFAGDADILRFDEEQITAERPGGQDIAAFSAEPKG